ncbi:MAG: ethanolamine ammonia-lyase subunit EutC [Xanthobacteraceae bacterium]|nr:ethanolamine ammonia-lyase subunit EutC [Xanthobacteraceae bacterium]
MSVPVDDPWARMRAATPARIALPRTGSAIATPAHLAFQLAHARARDAVHAPFDPHALLEGLRERGFPTLNLHSAAADRAAYLARPDLGRRLDAASRSAVEAAPHGCDLVFVIADGLSAQAVTSHVLPLIDQSLPTFRREGWQIGPAAIVEQGRVAIGDEIGQILDTALVCVLIGERPGLTSPDSLGIYLTWQPRIGRTDAERNCLSNIRPAGMVYDEASHRLMYLCGQARLRQCTGVMLKDETPSNPSLAAPD